MKKLLRISKMKKAVAIALSLCIVLSCAVLTANAIKNVRLTDGERKLVLQTYTTSTGKILSQANVTLDFADEVKRKESDDTIYIEVLRAFPVHIMYHNMEHVEFVTGGTVADVLKTADIHLSVDDVINVSGDTEVYDGMDIVIDEVKYITKTDEKSLKHDTIYKESSEYPQGYEEVVDKGKNGKSEITTTYKYVNGEFHSISGKVEDIVTKPESKVVLKGTASVSEVSSFDAPVSDTVSKNSGVSSAGTIKGMSYSKVLTGSATAYTASHGALTSTGVPAYVGGVAVNPNIIPYGSKLYIEADGYTYGYATAVDTGGALMSGTALVDLYMSTYDECINFGRRNVKVYILS
ncbi:MAG: hypothetical protein E7513_04060 [Ruminococcaceae bacterium]|nr:hypothetical protein [Oscillospiraceae bacterium]